MFILTRTGWKERSGDWTHHLIIFFPCYFFSLAGYRGYRSRMNIINRSDNNISVRVLQSKNMNFYLVRRRGRVTREVRGGQRVNISSCSDPNTFEQNSRYFFIFMIYRRLLNFIGNISHLRPRLECWRPARRLCPRWGCRGFLTRSSPRWTTSRRWSTAGWTGCRWGREGCTWSGRRPRGWRTHGMSGSRPQGQRSSPGPGRCRGSWCRVGRRRWDSPRPGSRGWSPPAPWWGPAPAPGRGHWPAPPLPLSLLIRWDMMSNIITLSHHVWSSPNVVMFPSSSRLGPGSLF